MAPLERLKILMQIQGNEKVYTGVWQVGAACLFGFKVCLTTTKPLTQTAATGGRCRRGAAPMQCSCAPRGKAGSIASVGAPRSTAPPFVACPACLPACAATAASGGSSPELRAGPLWLTCWMDGAHHGRRSASTAGKPPLSCADLCPMMCCAALCCAGHGPDVPQRRHQGHVQGQRPQLHPHHPQPGWVNFQRVKEGRGMLPPLRARAAVGHFSVPWRGEACCCPCAHLTRCGPSCTALWAASACPAPRYARWPPRRGLGPGAIHYGVCCQPSSETCSIAHLAMLHHIPCCPPPPPPPPPPHCSHQVPHVRAAVPQDQPLPH